MPFGGGGSTAGRVRLRLTIVAVADGAGKRLRGMIGVGGGAIVFGQKPNV
jgi:hypothetical protein